MKKTLLVSLCLVLSVSLVASLAFAKNSDNNRYKAYKPYSALNSPVSLDQDQAMRQEILQLNRSAAVGTTWLSPYPDGWTFDVSGSCNAQGWTTHDLTAQLGDYWHVDDFLNMNNECNPLYLYTGHVGVLAGSQSLWCGARCSTTINPFCGYAKLPGYGNNWNQAFCTSSCENVGTGATVDFIADWDSEGNYDATSLEFTDCAGPDSWISIGGGIGVWDGNNGAPQNLSIAIPDSVSGVPRSASIKLRFHFQADGAWSDEDGLNNSDGAFALDNLSVSPSTNLSTAETFETESVGATATDDGLWSACTPSGYGDLAVLYNALSESIVDEDPCFSNITCMWTFYTPSTANYGCGGWPAQTALPYVNSADQYVNCEVWSPVLDVTALTGVQYELQFDSYRDLLVNPLIFYIWHVRSIDAGGCAGTWRDRNYVYYGGQKDWIRQLQPIGDLISPTAVSIQVAMGAVDMCPVWCGYYGDGTCHSHAPLLDNVTLYNIEAAGPQWSIRTIDTWQDTFADGGAASGVARIDVANDINPASTINIRPGDSLTVQVGDPQVGLKTTTTGSPGGNGGSEVYCYVRCQPDPPFGLDRFAGRPADIWQVVDSTTYNGDRWAIVQMDTAFNDGDLRQNSQPDRFSCDINDNLFVTGDTISWVFAATNTNNITTYWTPLTGSTSSLTQALDNPGETTILPAGGVNNGGDILYVDGMDGRGAQPYFDTAFQKLGIFDQVDRYDIQAPSSGVANRLGARVSSVANQLLPNYRKIIWNTGDLRLGVLGDGTTDGSEKSPDAQVLNAWLNDLDNGGPGLAGGIYFNGDNFAEEWTTAAQFLSDTYIQYTLVDGNHNNAGFAVSPLVIGEGGGMFDHVAGPDTLIAYGGCPLINDFDVLAPTLLSVQEAKYDGGSAGTNGAVISQKTENVVGDTVGVVLSGFSYHFIRDDGFVASGQLYDRAEHLKDIIAWLNNELPTPTGATVPDQYSLSQNYPNPFNPQTTIEFTLKELAPVSLKIYNVRGQLVRTLVDETRAPGITHTVTWDGRNDTGQQVSSGVYFYKLVSKNFTQTKKMVLLK